MKQRVVIAIAISLRPKVIIADEPTSALDVVVQRQVMETLRRVQEELGAAVILIGHDMGLMAQFVDRLGVMYAGRLVEVVAGARRSSRTRSTPTRRLLIASLPSLEQKGVLRGIPGLPPSLLQPRRRAAPSTRAARTSWSAAASRCRRFEREAAAAAGSPATSTNAEGRPMTDAARSRATSPRSSAAVCSVASTNVALDDFSLRIADRPAGDHGGRRRERQRQDDAGPPAARPRRARPRARCSTGARICARSRGQERRAFRREVQVDLPGPVRGLQPLLPGRPRPDDADRQVRAGPLAGAGARS